MKLALVSTPDHVRAWLPHLMGLADVRLFVEPGREGEQVEDLRAESADALWPREHDQILFALGNVAAHGFAAPLVRLLGGTVALRDWVLFDLALAAFPALADGGPRGRWIALREGGIEQARALGRAAPGALAGCRSELALNRSVIRFADGFVVPTSHMRGQILEERNAPTPIAVVPADDDPAAAARKMIEALEAFPHPRSAGKRLFWRRVRHAARERAE